jgi:hypothetical protein
MSGREPTFYLVNFQVMQVAIRRVGWRRLTQARDSASRWALRSG